jgi:hypothetical protein
LLACATCWLLHGSAGTRRIHAWVTQPFGTRDEARRALAR